MSFSAPGKLLLLGEYAVVNGAPAVVLAVNRRARTCVPAPGQTVGALVEQAWRETFLALEHTIPTESRPSRVDSSAFYQGKAKLGLGSSAAVCLLTCAEAWRLTGRTFDHDEAKQSLWELAKKIHDTFQQATGSGADLAASLWGGAIRFQHRKDNAPVAQPISLPASLALRFIWTGTSASTSKLLTAVRSFAKAKPDHYRALLQQMEEIATTLLQTPSNVTSWLESMNRYGHAMRELGQQSGAPIVTPMMATLMNLAQEHGGIAKPSGAGGGDFLIAAFGDETSADAFCQASTIHGATPLSLCVDPDGLVEQDDNEGSA